MTEQISTVGQRQYLETSASPTRWALGDAQRTSKRETFTRMRLCRPGATVWYPMIAEKDAALTRKDETLTEQAALLVQYVQRFGPLEADTPAPSPDR